MPPHAVKSRRQLTLLRRRLWNRLQTSARQVLGPTPQELRRYELSYRRSFPQVYRPATMAEVIDRALASDVVFCGDYHTYRPAQATCARLLEAMTTGSPRVALLVELALTAHQPHLDAWVAGRIEESELLRRLRYERTWGFAWAGYRTLFERARAHGVPIIGLNGPGTGERATLAERDDWAAAVIAGTARRLPQTRLLVLTGDLHLAPGHLPGRVKNALPGATRSLILYQNNDDIYWELARRHLELEVVALAADAYCVFNGTPWAKLESYLGWLEGSERPELGEVDYSDHIVELTETLGRFLGLGAEGAEDYAVCTRDELGNLAPAIATGAARAEVALVPEASVIYLASLDLDHACAGAAELLLELNWGDGRSASLGGEGGFWHRAYRQAVAALGARFLNPLYTPSARPGRTESGLIAAYARLATTPGLPIAAAAFEDDLKLGHAISRAVGHRLGAHLYQAFVAGRLPAAAARRLFTDPPLPGEGRAAFAALVLAAAEASDGAPAVPAPAAPAAPLSRRRRPAGCSSSGR